MGGGIVAAFLEAWFRNLREYETARLLIAAELESLAMFSRLLSEAGAVTDEPFDYPTAAWRANNARLAIRAAKWDQEFLRQLASFMTLIESIPPGKRPLGEPTLKMLELLRIGIDGAQLGFFAEAAVYGPIESIARNRRRKEARRRWLTGAQIGAQGADPA